MTDLILEVSREAYGISDVRRTMTVAELIEFLSDFNDDTKVYVSHDNGYTYGGIRESAFEEREREEDE